MKCKSRIITLILVSIFVFGACGKPSNTEKTMEKVEDTKNIPTPLDKVYCTLKNADYVFYSDLTNGRMVTFYLLSPKELNENSVKINIDTIVDYSWGMVEDKNDKFPYYVFQAYNDVDWKKMKDLYVSNDTESYVEYRDFLMDEYKELDKNLLPDIYAYQVTVNFKMDKLMNEDEINQIEIECNGKAAIYDIGSIKLKRESKVKINEKGIVMNVTGVSDYPIYIDDQGKLSLDNQFSFSTNNDITLKKIENVLDNNKIEDISVEVKNGDNAINQKWDGNSNLSIGKGSTVTIYGNIIDDNFKKNNLYSTIKYLMLTYEINGTEYFTKMEYSYISQLNKYEYAAILNDDIDIPSYYLDYYKYID